MVPQALVTLRQEHRQMTKLLELLARQIALVAEGREADTVLLFEIADYFRSYPDLYHHPKEDLIADKLRVRIAGAAEALERLGAEHEGGSQALIRFCHALVDFSMNPTTTRAPFLAASRNFLDGERLHMAWEEERFFPTAEAALHDEDWIEIDSCLARLKIPDFQNDARARFARLGAELKRWRGSTAA